MTPSAKSITASRMAMRTAVILLVFVIVFTALLSGAYLSTRSAIQAAAEQEKMKLIDEIVPRSAYDNDLLRDVIDVAATPALGQNEAIVAYRARQRGQPVALVLEAIAPDGYAGNIRLILAVAPEGTLLGVRVVEHKETPGLGDYIDPKKDKNKTHPWIGQFVGANPASRDEHEWKVKKDGGRFDSLAGATISPRAVIKAVGKAAVYVRENRERLFAP